MRKAFTLRVEEKLINHIKKLCIDEGLSNADKIEDLILKGLAYDLFLKTKEQFSDFTLFDDSVYLEMSKQIDSLRRIYINE